MDVGIQSLWIILTVMVPGLVFYGTFWLISFYLKLSEALSFIDKSETTSLAVLFALMFTLQLFGIATESFFFKFGPYKHKNREYQSAFDRRYEIISSMDPEKDYHVERILSQFFMSHNIAVGMTINLLLVMAFLFGGPEDSINQDIINTSNIPNYSLDDEASRGNIIFIIILIITMLSWFVSYNRFHQSCNVLYNYTQRTQGSKAEENRSYPNKKDNSNNISRNLIIISCLLIGGGIGHYHGHLEEGALLGLAIGFMVVSYLSDNPINNTKRVIDNKNSKYIIGIIISACAIIYAKYGDAIFNTILRFTDNTNINTSIALILLGFGIAMSAILSIKNVTILEEGYLKKQEMPFEDRANYKIRFLDEDNLKEVSNLQEVIMNNLNDNELYQPAPIHILKDRLSKKQSAIGVFTNDGLIAYGIIHIPGKANDNLGNDINMPESDFCKVAQLQYIVVHPNYRGNMLQKKLVSHLLSIVNDLEYEHVLGIVSPKNYFSLHNLLCLGFMIEDINKKHGGMSRCIIHKHLHDTNPKLDNFVNIINTDVERQSKFIKDGFVGFAISNIYEKDFYITYGKKVRKEPESSSKL
jgi:hypothetical protein